MRKKIFYAIIFVSILISSSVVIAAPKETPPGQLKEKNAPGQWKKNESYTFANQQEFVYAVHMKIWERMQARNELRVIAGKVNMISPLGLLKLLNLIVAESEQEEEEELEVEGDLEPESELETEDEPEPEEELEIEPEEEPEIEEEEPEGEE